MSPERRMQQVPVEVERRLGDPALGPTATLRLLEQVLARESGLTRAPLTGSSFLKAGWDRD